MIGEYLINHYVFQVAVFGLTGMLIIGGSRDDKLTTVMLMSTISAFVLSLLAFTDIYISEGSEYRPVRLICSVLSYILRPAIIHIYIEGFSKSRRVRRICRGLLAVNTAVFLMSFFTDYVVCIGPDNIFYAPYHLNYIAYAVSAVLLFYLAHTSLLNLHTGGVTERMLTFFLALAVLGGAVVDTLTKGHYFVLVNCIAVCNCLYFIFAYLKGSIRDTLTGLFNRSAFFHDTKKLPAGTSAIVSLDMNELKWINDTQGHAAGDEALRRTGEILLESMPKGSRAYRTGGDEFCVALRISGVNELTGYEQRLRETLSREGLSCAVGGAMHEGDITATIKAADEKMYADKARLRKEHDEGLNSIHFRV